MAVTDSYFRYIQDQLSTFGEFDTKKMFGGIGFFREGKMFGMIGNDVFRLKANESNQADFESRGMQPLISKSKKKSMPYWEVPAEVVKDKKELKKWADKSVAIALAGKK